MNFALLDFKICGSGIIAYNIIGAILIVLNTDYISARPNCVVTFGKRNFVFDSVDGYTSGVVAAESYFVAFKNISAESKYFSARDFIARFYACGRSMIAKTVINLLGKFSPNDIYFFFAIL